MPHRLQLLKPNEGIQIWKAFIGGADILNVGGRKKCNIDIGQALALVSCNTLFKIRPCWTKEVKCAYGIGWAALLQWMTNGHI